MKKTTYTPFFLMVLLLGIVLVPNQLNAQEFDSVEVDNEVLIPAKENYVRIGDFVNVQITDAEHFDLFGKVIA